MVALRYSRVLRLMVQLHCRFLYVVDSADKLSMQLMPSKLHDPESDAPTAGIADRPTFELRDAHDRDAVKRYLNREEEIQATP
jgi:hypothetical protein